ncbi:MAG: ATP-binding protein [Planctomycetota bacterium]
MSLSIPSDSEGSSPSLTAAPPERSAAVRAIGLLRRSVLEGPVHSVPRPRSEINLHWLIHLRWTAILGQLTTILVVRFGLQIEIPIAALLAVIGVEIGTNLALLEIQRREVRRRLRTSADAGAERRSDARLRALQLGVTLLDIVLLAALLSLTGGTSNPFCAFLVVHVALAAVLLPMRHSIFAIATVGLAVLALRLVHTDIPALEESSALRGWGMVVAIALTSMLTVFFVSRVVSAVVRRSEQLEAERERRERRRHLEALGTLAAGAAHELGTPLSTIAIVAKELERRLEGEGRADDGATQDARLIRDEVARCRRILDRMSNDAGGPTGESLVATTAPELAAGIVGEMGAGDRVDVVLHSDEANTSMALPREGLATALRAIVQNALDASPIDQQVRLELSRRASELVVTVSDRGVGMEPAEVERALEPFFTTKEVGLGMGLGLYLASSFIESLGGTLEIHSVPGEGTDVRVLLPLAPAGEWALAARMDPL